MLKNIFTIFKKECARFFRDKRMVFSVILLPGLLIYSLYSLLSLGMSGSTEIPEDYAIPCYVQNLPDVFADTFTDMGFDVMSADDVAHAKQQVAQQKADLFVSFPADFEEQLTQSTDSTPNVQIYYNSDNPYSYLAYEIVDELLNSFEDSFFNILDINNTAENPDLANGSLIMSMIPFMIILLLFYGCQSIAPESIAGEKERGTIATLLVTPVSRTSVAIGKVISISFFAILSGLSSFTGLALSMPKLLGSMMDMVDFSAYGTTEYLCLLGVILTTVLLCVAILSVISTNAKSVKEATSGSTAIIIIAMVLSIVPVLPLEMNGMGLHCIPFLNSALSLFKILVGEYSVSNILITCGSNLVISFGLIAVMAMMFNSERIMFKK